MALPFVLKAIAMVVIPLAFELIHIISCHRLHLCNNDIAPHYSMKNSGMSVSARRTLIPDIVG
jgi:hypothetical protein